MGAVHGAKAGDGDGTMTDMIGIEVSGIPEVKQMLERVDGLQGQKEAVKAGAEFLRGKLQRYPDYKHISRAEAYGQTFQSEKQRRWFFAALASGELTLPYKRTRKLRNAWQMVEFGSADVLLVNETSYAKWVQQEATQARMMRLIGWQSAEGIAHEWGPKVLEIMAERWRRYAKVG